MKTSIFKAGDSGPHSSRWVDSRCVDDRLLAAEIFQAALNDGTIHSEGTYVLVCFVQRGFEPDAYPYVFEVERVQTPEFRIKERL